MDEAANDFGLKVQPEGELLARYARERDAEAFRSLLERHRDMVFATSRRILGNGADAEDVAQDCFILLARNAGKLRAPLAGWLHRVAVRISLNRLRDRRAQRERELHWAERRGANSEPTWDELQSAVDEAIARLPERLRVPIILYYLEERTQECVTDELRVSQAEISRRLRQGVETLRRHLRRSGFSLPAVALATMLGAHAAEGSPSSLVSSLGKLALSGATASLKTATDVGVIGGMSVMKIGIATALAATVILGSGIAVQSIRAQAPAKLEIRNPNIETNPKSAIQNPKSDLPTADGIFAEMSKRAQAIAGLTWVVDVRKPMDMYDGSRRAAVEFRAPDCLRCEVTAWPEPTPSDTSPAISVITAKDRWTYWPNRDEVADGATDPGNLQWTSAERLLAAQLAPTALYRDYPKRSVFPDKLNGKPCYLVVLQGKGLDTERLWIDPEKSTVLRWTGPFEGGKTMSVLQQKEVAPGLWLPTSVSAESGWYGTQVSCHDVILAAPVPERFQLPREKTCFVRPADLTAADVAAMRKDGSPAADYVAARKAQMTPMNSRGGFDQEAVEKNLKEFVARNPRFRAGYYDLANLYNNQALWFGGQWQRRSDARAILESALRIWPDDIALKYRAFWCAEDAAASLELAQELCKVLPPEVGLEILLHAQNQAKMTAEARKTAGKLIDAVSHKDVKDGWWMWMINMAAHDGGWLDDIRKECEQRACEQPPSEAHLVLLPVLKPGMGLSMEDAPYMYRIAELGRKSGSPEVVLQCLSGRGIFFGTVAKQADEITDKEGKLRFILEQNAPKIVALYSYVLDHLPEEATALRAEAFRSFRGWPGGYGQKAIDGFNDLILKNLEENRAKLTQDQLLWRYRILAFGSDWQRTPGKSIPYLEKALALAPDDDDLNADLASRLAGAGRIAEARKRFESLEKDHPGRSEVWAAHLDSLNDHMSPEEMAEVVARLVACGGSEGQAFFPIANIYARFGRLDDLLQVFERNPLPRYDAADFDLHNQRVFVNCRAMLLSDAGTALVKAGDADGGVKAWTEAIGLVCSDERLYGDDEVILGNTCGAFANAAGDNRDWIEKQWIPALKKALERYDKDGSKAQRAMLRYVLANEYLKLGDTQEAAEYAWAAKELWVWPPDNTYHDWTTPLLAKLPPAPEEVAAKLKTLLDSGKVVWKKEDSFDKNTFWVAFEDHLVGFDRMKFNQNEFGFELKPYQTAGIAFAENRVYVGTSKGIVVYNRLDGFWYRLAVGGQLVEVPVTAIELTKDGALDVTITQDNRPRKFEFAPRSGTWSNQPAK